MNNKIILSEIIMDYLSQLGFYNELNSKVKSFLNDLKLGDNVILKLLKNLEQNGFRFLNNENMFRKLRMLGLDEDVLTNLAKFLNEESTKYKIVNYFLVKNINTIFGKNEFDKNDIDINLVVEDNNNKISKLKITYADNTYVVSRSLNGQILEMAKPNSMVGFNICIKDNGSFLNNIVINEFDNEVVYEYQNVNLLETPTFDYQKIINVSNNEEFILPAYRLSPVDAKIGNLEFFSIELLDRDENYYIKNLIDYYKQLNTTFPKKVYHTLKEYLKKRKNTKSIVSISTSYDFLGEDIYDYLDVIYRCLEERCEEEVLSLKKIDK